MKKRTLNQTWTLCLRMWRSISKKWAEGDNIYDAKRKWLIENRFFPSELESHCFFCDYNIRFYDCRGCPGQLVNKSFTCENADYNYETNPPAFYKELLRLNRIRKAKK